MQDHTGWIKRSVNQLAVGQHQLSLPQSVSLVSDHGVPVKARVGATILTILTAPGTSWQSLHIATSAFHENESLHLLTFALSPCLGSESLVSNGRANRLGLDRKDGVAASGQRAIDLDWHSSHSAGRRRYKVGDSPFLYCTSMQINTVGFVHLAIFLLAVVFAMFIQLLWRQHRPSNRPRSSKRVSSKLFHSRLSNCD